VTDLVFIFRERRDEIFARWIAALEGQVDEAYRELLSSPLGALQLRKLIDDLVSYNEAEEYETAATLRRIEQEMATDAERRVSVGFVVADLLTGLHLLRAAFWDSLGDAVVVGDLPATGEVMVQMRLIDWLLDRLTRAVVAGALRPRDEVDDEL
jgi:hypothetical protein